MSHCDQTDFEETQNNGLTVSQDGFSRYLRLVQEFGAKLVLEVFGGAGAIWGFSEAVGLRTQENVWFWRPVALTFGVIFAIRWFGQLMDAVFTTAATASPSNTELMRRMPFDLEVQPLLMPDSPPINYHHSSKMPTTPYQGKYGVVAKLFETPPTVAESADSSLSGDISNDV